VRLEAIIFDVGNTLGPWRMEHGRAFMNALKPVFEQALGPMPDFASRAAAAHERFRRERFHGTFREVTCAEFVEAVVESPVLDRSGGASLRSAAPAPDCSGGASLRSAPPAPDCSGGASLRSAPPAPPGLASEVAAKAHEAFLDTFEIPSRVKPLLERLGRRYRLGVLSNFFLTRPIVAALERAGIDGAFAHIEVSATGGWMKPHPAPFETVREKLGSPMERTLMVGDDFWADVVGGHRAGLLTALTREHFEGPDRDPRAPGIAADRILKSLDELEG